jgi:phage shock protein B
MELTEAFAIPAIIFMIFVAPIWIIMHYRSKRKISEGLSEHEIAQLNDLSAKAERMADRINTLEAILDSEAPNWRRRHE